MTFSQRIGKKAASKEIQIEQIDDDLKNGLWNLVKFHFLDTLEKRKHHGKSEFQKFSISLWHNFFKLPIDRMPSRDYEIIEYIREFFYERKWYEIYDLIEFILNISTIQSTKNDFINALNRVLEREFSGYRIIKNKIAPISNNLEFEEVSTAIEITGNLTSLKGANIHLEKALDIISDKKNPNYRNSIKESISAVESTCRLITGESTLGKALNKLETNGLNINSQIKSGFEKIYSYTNSKENGIRHAIVEQPNEPDFFDAKYMLVSCSVFINYLIGKAGKIGM